MLEFCDLNSGYCCSPDGCSGHEVDVPSTAVIEEVIVAKYSIQDIKVKLCTDDRWLYRGITAIYKRQTADEQSMEATTESNGVGFNGVDAGILSSFAKQIEERGSLSENQRMLARKKMLKYAGQLKRIADSKGE